MSDGTSPISDATDWRGVLRALAAASGETISFRDPASAMELDRLEAEFGLRLPAEYRDLMGQTAGVFGAYDCAELDRVEQVALLNRDARSQIGRMPLDHLFFVSSAYGNGDLVGYGMRRDGWGRPKLYRWDHEDDSRTWEAPDLKTWFEWRYARTPDP